LSDQFLGLEDKLAALITERDALISQVPTAHEAVRLALRAHEDAQFRRNTAILRVNKACGSGPGIVGILSPALAEFLQAEDALYHAAGAALTRARFTLKELEFQLSCRNSDVDSLSRLINPPKPVLSPQRLIGPAPASEVIGDEFDTIVMPSRAAP
jgi:hypothetical protein